MPDYDLRGLNTRTFQQLAQALAVASLGVEVIVYGDGRDGARDASFQGKLTYGTSLWDSYLIIQAKFQQKSKGSPAKDGRWLIEQLKKDLSKFGRKGKAKTKAPEYFILITNIDLSAVPIVGTDAMVRAELAKQAKRLKMRGFDVWDGNKLRSLLDRHRDIAISYGAFITPGDILAELRERLKESSPDFRTAMSDSNVRPPAATIPATSAPQPGTQTMSMDNAKLPGISLHFFIRIGNVLGDKRQYILDFGNMEGERLSLYISRDNNLTFSFVDAKQEVHPLAIPFGVGGVPIAEFIYLSCELGIGATMTELRFFMGEQKLRELILPFKTDIGMLDIPNGVVGADLSGSNGAEFDLAKMFTYSTTLTNSDRAKNAAWEYLYNCDRFVEFKENQWMRFADASLGRNDLLQDDLAKAPKLRVVK